MSKMITLRTRQPEIDALKTAASAMDMHVSQYIRRAIEAQMRADRDEAAEDAQCAHIVLSAAHDAGKDTMEELFRYWAANLRWAALGSALEDFTHG